MFKKGKPDTREAAAEAHAPVAAQSAHPPVMERTAPRAAVPEQAPPAATVSAAPAAAVPAADAAAETPAAGAASPTPGAALLEGANGEKPAEAPKAAIDDAATSNLMHIFTEDQEGMNAHATIYEAFLEQLTMAQVAENAQTLLRDLKAVAR